MLVFGVAFLIVLLVLAAQFENITSAVSIMVTVPFGIAAAVLAISLSGGTLNYYSQIGLVLLVGVMAKNGILIVEFANQLRAAGQNIDSAIRDAIGGGALCGADDISHCFCPTTKAAVRRMTASSRTSDSQTIAPAHVRTSSRLPVLEFPPQRRA